jgi:anti-anti-sigma factor
MLRVDIQSGPQTVTLVCRGRLVLSLEAETLRYLTMARQEQHVLLEMSRVGRIDAAGLGLLVQLHQSAQKRRATLVIANPSLRTHQLITLTSLDQVLNIAGSPKNAANDSQECCTMMA